MTVPSRLLLTSLALILFTATEGRAQLLATDDFESYAGSPIGQAGGTGSWSAPWSFNTQQSGGAFLNTDGKIGGSNSLGLYGSDGASGTSVSRPFPACTNETAITVSFRADYDVAKNALNPAGQTRLAFTVRNGNFPSHFSNQLVSCFFAAGSTDFQWYDGTDRATSAVPFATGHVYDLGLNLNPATRGYALTASNRTTGAAFTYNGTWTTGFDGQSLGSVAFLMRGPSGAGNDAFIDDVTVSAPAFSAPPAIGLHTVEGSLWRYFKGTSTPTIQGTNNWTSIGFDDSAWLGPAPSGFGYDDCDDGTILGDMLNSYVSVFTRRTFEVLNPGTITHLTLAADYDDGFVAYLNGAEIARRNVPAGTPVHTTVAAGNHEASRGPGSSSPATTEKEFIALDPALLVPGTNVLAVSGHNVSAGSSDLTLIVELYTNSALVRGPFVQMPQPGNRATIVWRTAAALPGAVDYGLDPSCGAGTVSNAVAAREQAITLDNLLPGTTYYYRVRSNGDVVSPPHLFHTRADTNQSFRFAVIGDHGQGTDWMYNIAARLNARSDFDALLTVGDNIYGDAKNGCNVDGGPGWYDPFWFRLYGPTMRRVATFPALGNHDKDSADGNWQVANFHSPTNGPATEIEKNYSFTFGNVHFVVIDSDPFQNNETSRMAAITSWLSNDLAAATAPWKMAFFHHPAFTSQGSHNDNERVKSFVIPILKAHGVQYVFQGHNHFYERINAIDGIHYSTCGACGAYLYSIFNRKPYSARVVADKHSYTVVDIQGTRLKLEQFDESDVKIDEFNLDIGHTFAIDGLLDDPAWLRAENGLRLYAAIRGHHLYVAAQDAGEGSDHFIYVADAPGAQTAANWDKAGTVMQWGAFLADENDGGFQSWFDAAGTALTDFDVYQSMTSGLNNNEPYGTNGVMEGTIDLPGHFGHFPAQLRLAAAPFMTTNGGHLLSAFQVPAGNGNGDIEAGEFLAINTRDLALDLPVAEAGDDQSVEAGMWAVLDGAGSASPINFPLGFVWSQVSGPAVLAVNTNLDVAAITPSANVTTNTDVTFRLVVNDGRFDSDADTVTVTFIPMVDSDGDGLSDNEETTGWDNILTTANPAGRITNPNDADSDDDLVSDGEEALAGTDPNNGASSFRLLSGQPAPAAGVEIGWSTVSGRMYEVYTAGEPAAVSWQSLASFTATSDVTRTTDTNTGGSGSRVYRIGAAY